MAEYNVVSLCEIRDEFATCEICEEEFDMSSRSPRILPCSHSFCCECLERIWGGSTSGVQCPKCRRIWQVDGDIKSTFHQNNVLMNLVEYLAVKNKPGNILCWQCPRSLKATVHCLDCQRYLCVSCCKFHGRFLEYHKTVPLSQFVESPQVFFQQRDVCKDHDRMKMDLFCKSCQTAACISCAYVSHKDHEVCNLKDVYEERKKVVHSALDGLLKSTARSSVYRDTLVEQKNALQAMQRNLLQYIDDVKMEIIEKVQEKSKQLKDDVTANVTKQQADRDEQVKIVEQSENGKAEHALRCRQALAFTRAWEFIAMSEDLETQTKTLTEIPDLLDMQIQNVNLDMESFEKINLILQKTAGMFDECDTTPCIEVTDAKLEEDSIIIKVMLLRKVNASGHHLKSVLLQAVVEDKHGNEHKVEQSKASISHDGGSLVYRSGCLGLHKARISINGRQLTRELIDFHSKQHDTEVARKILIGIDGEPGRFIVVVLPPVLFDRDKLNWERRRFTEDGFLTNGSSPKPEFEHDARLRHLCGVTATTPLSGPGSSYWQVYVIKEVLEEADVGYVSAQTGICRHDSCDESEFEENQNAWGVEIRTCKEHDGLCLHVFARGELLCDSPLTGFKPQAVVDVELGFLLDFDKRTFHVIHVPKHEVVFSIPDIDTHQPLVPVFTVYSPSLFDVKLRAVSGTELVIDCELVSLLSRLVQP